MQLTGTLTLQEAIDQGYEHFFYKGEGYQRLNILSEIEDSDFDKGVELANKEPHYPTSLDSHEIADWIADTMQDRFTEETGDDTNSVYDLLKDLDCTPIVESIEAKLKSMQFYKSSGIKLIKTNK